MSTRRIDPRVFEDSHVGDEYVDLTPQVPMGQMRDLESSSTSALVEKRIESLNDRFNEFEKVVNHKMSVIDQKINLLVDRLQALVDDKNSQFQELSGRIRQMGLSDAKVEGLVERHNQIVANFESKMSKLQKTVEDQELKLMNTSALLKEAQRALENLKRY